MKTYLFVVVFGFISFLTLLFLAHKKLNQYSQEAHSSAKIDWILVLGNGPGLTEALKIRLDNALLAHQLWPNAKIVITGADVEIPVMKKYLQNVPPENLVEENQSTSTWSSFKNCKKIIPESDFVLIITNDFHQRRSLATARLMGYKAALFGRDKNILSKTLFYKIREQFSAIKWYVQYLLY